MKEDEKIHVVGNKDNANLGPMPVNGFVIGAVDEINGKGGEEIPGFIPTRDELLPIVKYWFKQILDLRWFYFNTGGTGSTEWRLNVFADRRISRIASLLGEEDVNQAIDEVYIQFREDQHDNMRLWQIFRKGNQAQRDFVLSEYERCVENRSEATIARWAFAPNIVFSNNLIRHLDKFSTIYGGNYLKTTIYR